MPAFGARPHNGDESAVTVTDPATDAMLEALGTVGFTKSWVDAMHFMIAGLITVICLVMILSIVTACREPSIEETEKDLVRRKGERAAQEYFMKQTQKVTQDVQQELGAVNP
ncbi:uncharacterized protein PG998_004395 [Apiospora kogelbergensis]